MIRHLGAVSQFWVQVFFQAVLVVAILSPNGHAVDPIQTPEASSVPVASTAPPPQTAADGTTRPSRRLTLNFVAADILKILTAIAMQREVNIVTANDVSGNITLHLYDVTLPEALKAVTMAGGFDYKRKGSVYYVYKPEETQDPRVDKMLIKVFKLKYADSWKSDDFEKVKEILSSIPGIRTVNIHESSRTVIVEDTPRNIAKVEQVIRSWDVMPRQVMIEAKILEITLNDDMAMGVNWDQVLGEARIATGGFSSANLPAAVAASPVPTDAAGVFGSMITGIGTNRQFAVAIDALLTKTHVKTISTPRILALHGKMARVQVGGQQGYRETTTTNVAAAETIKFIDTGTTLEITPFIDDQENILLDVKPTIASATITGGIPVVTTTSVNTRLLAQNGQTIFIAGLIRTEVNDTRNEIPCLGGLPGLGLAFGRSTTLDSKRELVVLITPQIVHPARPSTYQSEAVEKVDAAEAPDGPSIRPWPLNQRKRPH